MQLINLDIAIDIVNRYEPTCVGSSRTVYKYGNSVLKVADPDVKSNVVEALIWEEYKDTELGKWLAPVTARTPCFRAIVMTLTEPPVAELPTELPACFCDTKVENFGLINGNFVCHDYGNIKVVVPTNLIKVDWDE